MPKRHHRKSMRGGLFEGLSNDLSNMGSSISQGASNMYQKAKNAVSPQPTYVMSTSTYGGRRHRSRKHMRGGFKDYTPTSGLAAHAASFSGQTAQPQMFVGGKTRRRRHRHNKSCKHRKH